MRSAGAAPPPEVAQVHGRHPSRPGRGPPPSPRTLDDRPVVGVDEQRLRRLRGGVDTQHQGPWTLFGTRHELKSTNQRAQIVTGQRLHAVHDDSGAVVEVRGSVRRGAGRGSAGPARGTPSAAPSGPARRRRSGGSRSRTPGATPLARGEVELVAGGVARGSRLAAGRWQSTTSPLRDRLPADDDVVLGEAREGDLHDGEVAQQLLDDRRVDRSCPGRRPAGPTARGARAAPRCRARASRRWSRGRR